MSSSPEESLSFKEGVEAFWSWFPTVAERFFETIERGACGELTDETVDFMSRHLPGMAWAFGPGENDGHSFTVSGEGFLPKQLLAEAWQSSRVEVDGWTFYASRQPSPEEQLGDLAITIGEDERIDMDSLLVQTNVDEENEKIDLTAWHSAYEHLPEADQYQILFLLLDETLGEFGTQTWIGGIEVNPLTEDQPHTRSLAQLPKYIQSVSAYHEWEKLPPTETYSLYEMPGDLDGPRGDTAVGNTCIMDVIGAYVGGKGQLDEDPLAETRAALAYIQIDGRHFPDGQQADVRGNIEDVINEALESHGSGRVLGGAFGLQSSYVDLLLLDGENSLGIVREQLHQLQIADAEVHFFAS